MVAWNRRGGAGRRIGWNNPLYSGHRGVGLPKSEPSASMHGLGRIGEAFNGMVADHGQQKEEVLSKHG